MTNPVSLVDVTMTTTYKTLRGPRGALLMCKKELAKDLDRAVFPGIQGGPHENVIAGKAVALAEAATPEFKDYARRVKANGAVFAEALMQGGLNLVTGGTDNHLVLVDLRPLGIRGKEAEVALEKAGVICNRNAVPFDDAPPLNPGGIRLGTPGATSRGMGLDEMKAVAGIIVDAISNREQDSALSALNARSAEIAAAFPPPAHAPAAS